MIVSIFGITNVSAATINIELTKIDIESKSLTITVEEPVISNNEITSNITFNQVDDYVNFKLTLKNNEGAGLKITSVNDNLENENIEVSYAYDDNTFIQPGETTTVYANMSYKTRLINEDKTINNFRINLTLEEEDGDDIVVPDTGSNTIITNQGKDNNVIYCIIASIVSAIGLTVIMLVKNKKIRLVVLAGVLATLGLVTVPIATHAEEKIEAFIYYTDIVIKGELEEYTVTFDTDGGTEIANQTVKYGEKATKPDTNPEKTDHIFEGWYTDDTYGAEFDFDSTITNNTTIYAGYHHKCRNFSTDSWDTINANIKGDTSYYGVGCEKDVDLGTFGIHKVRVANNTTPDICSSEGFSQTACGFVLEFTDSIAMHRMNPTTTNVGGWKDSEMRTYLSNDILNSLPSELKSHIIDTTVVSSHGSTDTSNFVTTDKLYLLSTKEVLGKNGFNRPVTDDSAEAETRQLDYYYEINVSTDNYDSAIKSGSDGPSTHWWLRSARLRNDTYYSFFIIAHSWNTRGAETILGVSPAFRIGINN